MENSAAPKKSRTGLIVFIIILVLILIVVIGLFIKNRKILKKAPTNVALPKEVANQSAPANNNSASN